LREFLEKKKRLEELAAKQQKALNKIEAQVREERRNKIQTLDREATHAEACKVVACGPARSLLDSLRTTPKAKDLEIDFTMTEDVLKDLEIQMFKRNIYKQPKIVVSTAVYLANKDLNMRQVSQLFGAGPHSWSSQPTTQQVRKLFRDLGAKKGSSSTDIRHNFWEKRRTRKREKKRKR